jgi:hypothetical protein
MSYPLQPQGTSVKEKSTYVVMTTPHIHCSWFDVRYALDLEFVACLASLHR